MTMLKRGRLALALAVLVTGTPALGQEVTPLPVPQPMADEKCIEQCDVQSDKCMQSAEGDSGKLQVCDDKYSECLQACEAR
jgi:hypothetical protein